MEMTSILGPDYVDFEHGGITDLGVAVRPPEASLAVGRTDGKGGAAVLDRLLVVPKLGTTGGSVVEENSVVRVLAQAVAIRDACLGELRGPEEIIASGASRGHRPGPPHHRPDLPATGVELSSHLGRRHRVVEPSCSHVDLRLDHEDVRLRDGAEEPCVLIHAELGRGAHDRVGLLVSVEL